MLARRGTAFLAVLCSIGLGLLGASASHAQEDVISNPPELRDFKLEPDKPKPTPQPLPQPSAPLPSSGETPPAARTPTVSQPQGSTPRQGPTAQPASEIVTRRPPPPTQPPSRWRNVAPGSTLLFRCHAARDCNRCSSHRCTARHRHPISRR